MSAYPRAIEEGIPVHQVDVDLLTCDLGLRRWHERLHGHSPATALQAVESLRIALYALLEELLQLSLQLIVLLGAGGGHARD